MKIKSWKSSNSPYLSIQLQQSFLQQSIKRLCFLHTLLDGCCKATLLSKCFEVQLKINIVLNCCNKSLVLAGVAQWIERQPVN